MKKIFLPVLTFALSFSTPILAQQIPDTTATTTIPETASVISAGMPKSAAKPISELKYNLTPDGTKYIKATFLNQVWLRYNQSNPGTTVNGDPQDNTVDIGLRRTRMQLFGQLTDHVFFYTQFGLNNFNYLAQNAGNRKLQAFFHDALGEYKVFKDNDKLKFGAGLTILNGLSRFTQPSVGTIMTTDVPVFLQATVDQTDEFARKLSVYARGQLGKLDYRVAVTDPFPIQTNGLTAPALGPNANFTTYGHTKQYQGFFIYNFLDKEPHTTPYMAGTYLGDKKVLNLESGIIYQKDATWYTQNGVDPIFDNMRLWSVAAFTDMPLQGNKFALSAYAGYFNTDYGHHYLRNNGIMNPANGSNDLTIFNGAGNAYPMFGTGESLYTQVGLRLPNGLLGDQGTLMPYVSYRRSSYDRLSDPINIYDAGINWLINKHMSKVSLNYQLRPVFETGTNGNVNHTSNASSGWLQYQIYF
ncbi:MAG: hypothetical protein COW65_10800 [Cytophagales bacterium CG18_big_fil_WC_8_21_14_2_50_42_9]|nr:MAG: hypothetical protein COW65_10800 [Cytophagales bacterium CG18_big_fil_WC_8_21_14_2_50_42_9]